VEISKKQIIKELLPRSYFTGSNDAILPVDKGLVVGIYLQKMRYRPDYVKIHLYNKLALNYDTAAMLNVHIIRFDHDEAWLRSNLLDNLTLAKSKIADAMATMNSLEKFSSQAMHRYVSNSGIQGLYELVASHYLNSSCRLPNIALTKAELICHLNITRKFEEDMVERVICLANEWNDSDFVVKRDVRIQEWLSVRKLPSSLFD
jgi:phage-related protein